MATKYDAPIKVFLSSAPEDEVWKEKLKIVLAGVKNIYLWDDKNDVSPGQDQESEIRTNLNDAHIILLLVSPDFIASDTCKTVVQWAIERHSNFQIPVIPIILHPCMYKKTSFGDLQPIPRSGKPIANLPNPYDGFHDVAVGVQEVVEVLLRSDDVSPDDASIIESKQNLASLIQTNHNAGMPLVLLTSSINADLLEILLDKLITHNRKGCIFQLRPLIIIFFIVALATAIAFAHAFPPSARVTIIPKSSEQNGTYTITAVTNAPDTAKLQVQARQLSSPSPSQSKTVNATGNAQGQGVQATGELTFYNGKTLIQTIAPKTLFHVNDVQIIVDDAVTIPAAQPPEDGQVTVPAHAVNPGINGNIAVLGINRECCVSDDTIFVKNLAPFTGGKDSPGPPFVQQSDIDNAANSLAQSLTPSAQSSLQAQVRSNEKFITQPECTKKVSSNHNANDRADKVDVSVVVICVGEVYDSSALASIATNLLKQDGTKNLGTPYAVIDKTIKTTVIQAKVIDAQGTVSLQVKAEGLYVYQFDAVQKQKLSKLIAGKTQQDAFNILKQQTGVVNAQIDAGIGNLPTDPANISIEIVIPTEKPKPNLTDIPGRYRNTTHFPYYDPLNII